MSDAHEGSLQKAVEKAATEVATAAAMISHGCERGDATETKIKNGPSDVIWEFNELNEKHKHEPTFKPDIVAYRIDENAPLVKFIVSSCGRHH